MFKDGQEILPYKAELKDVMLLLVDKTFSKRGYQWASRLLYSIILACTNTYPLDDRFVNADEWNSPGVLVSSFPESILTRNSRVSSLSLQEMGQDVCDRRDIRMFIYCIVNRVLIGC
jgi:hypothetical protein